MTRLHNNESSNSGTQTNSTKSNSTSITITTSQHNHRILDFQVLTRTVRKPNATGTIPPTTDSRKKKVRVIKAGASRLLHNIIHLLNAHDWRPPLRSHATFSKTRVPDLIVPCFMLKTKTTQTLTLTRSGHNNGPNPDNSLMRHIQSQIHLLHAHGQTWNVQHAKDPVTDTTSA